VAVFMPIKHAQIEHETLRRLDQHQAHRPAA
jgi:hypothetical protein